MIKRMIEIKCKKHLSAKELKNKLKEENIDYEKIISLDIKSSETIKGLEEKIFRIWLTLKK